MTQRRSATGVAYDCRGVPWTLSEDALVRASSLVNSWVGHRRDVRARLDALLDLDAAAVLGLAARAFGLALQGRRAHHPEIRRLASRAHASASERGASPSERALLSALDQVVLGRPERAAAVLDAHVAAQPLDLFALKLDHALHFLVGDTAGLARAILGALGHWRDDVPGAGFVHGCAAFAHVEAGDPEAAERAGRRAVELEPTDAWGRHAVGHVLAGTGRLEEGAAWLADGRSLLPSLGNFGGHLAWHEALLLTELGRPMPALALHDEHVAPWLGMGDYRDLANAAVLLPRLSRALPDAIAVEARQRAVAEHAASRCGDHGSPFADVHAVLALAAVDVVGARRFVRSMEASDERDWAGEVGREVALPVARAIVALAEGAPAHAASLLAQARPAWQRIGGSRIQRATLDGLLADARRAAQAEAAE